MIDGAIPDSWATVRLRDAGEWKGGGTPSKANAEYWTDGTIPWVSPKDMKTPKIRETEDRITETAVDGSATTLVSSGSVLMVTRSGILQRTLPVAVNEVEVALNQDLKALTPSEAFDPNYLLYLLRSEEQQILRECSKQGTTVQSIEFSRLLDFTIPLPPLAEQRRIVAAIETQLTRLEAAVAALERARANLKRYRAAVLAAACEGRLVPTEAELARQEGRAYEPACRTIELLQGDQGRRNTRRKSEPPIAELPAVPEGWTWTTLPQLGDLNRGKSRHRPRNDPRLLGGKYPFIQTADVRHARGFIRTFSQSYSEFGLAQSRLWPTGTLCITIAANIAETGILTFPACFPDSVVGFISREDTVVRFIEFFLRTAREKLERFAPATAQKNINLDTLSILAIPLPPLAEQERIVAEVERRLSGVEGLEAGIAAAMARAERLRQAVLREAFAGRLVPQDPSDEPASVLLARIRAERAAAGPAKRGRRRASS